MQKEKSFQELLAEVIRESRAEQNKSTSKNNPSTKHIRPDANIMETWSNSSPVNGHSK